MDRSNFHGMMAQRVAEPCYSVPTMSNEKHDRYADECCPTSPMPSPEFNQASEHAIGQLQQVRAYVGEALASLSREIKFTEHHLNRMRDEQSRLVGLKEHLGG